jgi:hypothetical protein
MADTRRFATTDYSKKPIVIVTLEGFEPTREEFNEHLSDLTSIVSMPGSVLILDISRSKFLASEHRIAAGNWLKNEKENFKKNVKGMAFVNNSLIMSAILKGVFLISKPPVDHIVSSSVDDAIAWANQRIS